MRDKMHKIVIAGLALWAVFEGLKTIVMAALMGLWPGVVFGSIMLLAAYEIWDYRKRGKDETTQ